MARGQALLVFLFLSLATFAYAGMKFNPVSNQFDITGEIPPGNAPASIASACAKGTFQHDSTYLYLCVDTDTWKRVQLSTWAVTDVLLLSGGTDKVLLSDGSSFILIRP